MTSNTTKIKQQQRDQKVITKMLTGLTTDMADLKRMIDIQQKQANTAAEYNKILSEQSKLMSKQNNTLDKIYDAITKLDKKQQETKDIPQSTENSDKKENEEKKSSSASSVSRDDLNAYREELKRDNLKLLNERLKDERGRRYERSGIGNAIQSSPLAKSVVDTATFLSPAMLGINPVIGKALGLDKLAGFVGKKLFGALLPKSKEEKRIEYQIKVQENMLEQIKGLRKDVRGETGKSSSATEDAKKANYTQSFEKGEGAPKEVGALAKSLNTAKNLALAGLAAYAGYKLYKGAKKVGEWVTNAWNKLTGKGDKTQEERWADAQKKIKKNEKEMIDNFQKVRKEEGYDEQGNKVVDIDKHIELQRKLLVAKNKRVQNTEDWELKQLRQEDLNEDFEHQKDNIAIRNKYGATPLQGKYYFDKNGVPYYENEEKAKELSKDLYNYKVREYKQSYGQISSNLDQRHVNKDYLEAIERAQRGELNEQDYYNSVGSDFYDDMMEKQFPSHSKVENNSESQSTGNGAESGEGIIHGTNAVGLKDIGLRGSVASSNSVPFVAERNKESLKSLDNSLDNWGYDVIYTSAMGGHRPGTGHWKGNKVDLQLKKDGKPTHLPSEQLNALKSSGYWGSGTGALGWEPVSGQVGGGHYDLFIGNNNSSTMLSSVGPLSKPVSSSVDSSTQPMATSEYSTGVADSSSIKMDNKGTEISMENDSKDNGFGAVSSEMNTYLAESVNVQKELVKVAKEQLSVAEDQTANGAKGNTIINNGSSNKNIGQKPSVYA